MEESSRVALCFQETKRNSFDTHFMPNMCHRRYDQFAFVPSVGASGGLLTAWNSSLSTPNRFSLTVKLTSSQSGQSWFLTDLYGPSAASDKAEFIHWLYNVDASAYDL